MEYYVTLQVIATIVIFIMYLKILELIMIFKFIGFYIMTI